MGQSYPSAALACNIEKLLEYRSCSLSRLGDIYSYWQKSSKRLELEKDEFESLFGLLLSDIESHYAIFCDRSTGLCSFYEVLYTVALFCDAKMDSKLIFLLGLKHRSHSKLDISSGDKIDASYVFETAYKVLTGLQRHFKILVPDKVAVVRFSEINFEVFIRRHRDFLYANRNDDDDDDEEDTTYSGDDMSVFDVFDMLQDIKESSDYIASLDEVCMHLRILEDQGRELYRHDQDLKLSMGHNKVSSNNKAIHDGDNRKVNVGTPSAVLFSDKMLQSERNPIWKYVVMDLKNNLWFEEMPKMTSEDNIFRILEVLVLSKRTAVPIYNQKEKIKSNNNDIRVKQVKKFNAIIDQKKDLFAIVDLFTIILWIAECIPETMKIRALREEKELLNMPPQRNKNISPPPSSSPTPSIRKNMSGNFNANEIIIDPRVEREKEKELEMKIIEKNFKLQNSSVNYGRLTELFPILNVHSEIDIEHQNHILNLDAKKKWDGNFWVPIGETFCTTTVRHAMRGIFLNNSLFPIVHESIDNVENLGDNMRKGFGQSSVKNILDVRVAKEVNRFSNNDVLQTDSYIYHVIERVARGYRNVPIAESQSSNETTHVVSLLDLIGFFRLHAIEIFGPSLFAPIVSSGRMCKPLCIPAEKDLASALLLLSSKNVESAVIVDTKGCICSILSTSILLLLWLECGEKERQKVAKSNFETPFGNTPFQNTIEKLSINNINKLNTKHKHNKMSPDVFESVKKMQDDYENGVIHEFCADSVNFEFFSVLDTPLKYCEKLGLVIKDMSKLGLVKTYEPVPNKDNHKTKKHGLGSRTNSTMASNASILPSAIRKKDIRVGKNKLPDKKTDVLAALSEDPEGDVAASSDDACDGDEGKIMMVPVEFARSFQTPRSKKPDGKTTMSSRAQLRIAESDDDFENGSDTSSRGGSRGGSRAGSILGAARSLVAGGGGGSVRGSDQGSVRGSVRGSVIGLAVGRVKKEKKKIDYTPMLVKTVMNPAQRALDISVWYKELGAILPTDSLLNALDAMLHTQKTRTYVLTEEGEAIGVITIENLCRDLILQERAQNYSNFGEMLRNNKRFYR